MKKPLFPLLLTATVALSGCALDVMNAVYLASIAANTTLYPSNEYRVPTELEQAIPLDYHREFWRADGEGKCIFSGVLLPYDRTWPEEIHNGDGNTTTLPPEPGKIAGYVSIINSKNCPPDKPQTMLWAGVQRTYQPSKFWGGAGVPIIDYGRFAYFTDMTELNTDKLPNWFPQVIERLARLAPTSPDIKTFLERSQDDLIILLPNHAGTIQAALQ